jgi:purine-binding chemotaxis protein CheW
MDGPRALGARAEDGTAQYLTFRLGDEEYGVDILSVQEIKGWTAVTPVPNAPAHVRGVMNLRGTVVPVFDLRLKFGMPQREHDRFTVIIVVHVGARVVGLVVDAVSDVLDLPRTGVEPTPDLGREVDTSLLLGLARSQERLITLLAVEQVVGAEGVVHLPSDAPHQKAA